MPQVSIIGYGSFGKLMANILKKYFEIFIFDPTIRGQRNESNMMFCESLQEIATKEFVIISVPMSSFESVILDLRECVGSGVTIIDVTSVKEKPIKIMEEKLPADVQIIGTHPLFGPKTCMAGIKNKKISLFSVRSNKYDCFKDFLTNKLGLDVIEGISPIEHDKQMAKVQALPHLIGYALQAMDLPDFKQSTATYHHLLSIADIVSIDSDELIQTIQNENSYAEIIREEFLNALIDVNKKIANVKTMY